MGRNQDMFISYCKLPAVAKLKDHTMSPYMVVLLLLYGREGKNKNLTILETPPAIDIHVCDILRTVRGKEKI